ncbi:Nucleolar protein 16 [Saitozyma podzolica]|uniref:Nucleolar protein 16 n=1 Tax=Saitozyma podzolica TaxID=1890683 RepID=A0A427XR87_9TREE|nr:Nucleolar protein 16 [Saitozyma podzolica]
MANPRQRSKARSHKSTKPSLNAKRRLHQKLRRKPTLNGPEVLQQGWDKHKTVFQNYAALGLLPSIPLPKGPSSSRSHRANLPFLPPHLRGAAAAFDEAVDADADVDAEAAPKVGFGRIIRDEDGNVVDIIIDEEPEQGDAQDDEEEPQREPVLAKTDVVKSLEALSATSAPVIRHSSTSEKTWLHDLVAIHGDDTEAMAGDKKRNVWQKTEGEIRRMIKKAGGRGRLMATA